MSSQLGEPVVSVVMPVFNTERYIAASIESILRQTFTDFEFIIIDDGSTDRSKEILEDYARKDQRIRLVSRGNTGYAIALNEGLEMARGQFVARMDSDDVSRPTRFAAQVEFLRERPDVVAVGGQVMMIDPDGELMYQIGHCPCDPDEIDRRQIEGEGGLIIHPAAMIRRDALQRVGCYRVELETAEDLDLFLRLAEVGRLANLAEVVLDYRVHPKSVSHTRVLQQMRAGRRATAEARARRGMPSLASHELSADQSPPEEEIFKSWARYTYRYGNYRIARKYALRAVRHDFMSLASWRLLLGSCVGASGKPLHRLYRKMKGLAPLDG